MIDASDETEISKILSKKEDENVNANDSTHNSDSNNLPPLIDLKLNLPT